MLKLESVTIIIVNFFFFTEPGFSYKVLMAVRLSLINFSWLLGGLFETVNDLGNTSFQFLYSTLSLLIKKLSQWWIQPNLNWLLCGGRGGRQLKLRIFKRTPRGGKVFQWENKMAPWHSHSVGSYFLWLEHILFLAFLAKLNLSCVGNVFYQLLKNNQNGHSPLNRGALE